MSYESIYMNREYVVVDCGKDGCSQHFAMSRSFYNETRRTGKSWYCPSGHSLIWKGETTEKKLEAAQARQRHLEDQLRAAEAEAESVRVRLLRDRQRFANGVCPRCNRTFQNVARHMATQHPDYEDAADVGVSPSYKCACGRSFGSHHGLRVHQGKSRTGDWNDPKRSKWVRHLTVVGA